MKGKGWILGFWFVMFIVILLLSHLVSVWYLIVSIPDPCCLSYFEKAFNGSNLKTYHIDEMVGA